MFVSVNLVFSAQKQWLKDRANQEKKNAKQAAKSAQVKPDESTSSAPSAAAGSSRPSLTSTFPCF